MYELFLKIKSHPGLSKSFFEGSCRRKLVHLTILVIEKKHSEVWRDWCTCAVPKWEILKKLCNTVANCILSKAVKNYNAMVVGRDNSKLQKSVIILNILLFLRSVTQNTIQENHSHLCNHPYETTSLNSQQYTYYSPIQILIQSSI